LVVAGKEAAAEAEEEVTMSLSRPEIVDDLKAESRAGTVLTH